MPKVDVLVSTVFQSLPGTEHDGDADFQQGSDHLDRGQRSAGDARRAPGGQRRRLPRQRDHNTTTVIVPLLLNNELYGERVNLTGT